MNVDACEKCGSDQFDTAFYRKCVKCGHEQPKLTAEAVVTTLRNQARQISELQIQVRRLNGIWGRSDKQPAQETLF